MSLVQYSLLINVPLTYSHRTSYMLCKLIKKLINSKYDCNIGLNPLSVNLTKWPNILKQFVGNLPTNYLSVLDHFVGLALKTVKCVKYILHINLVPLSIFEHPLPFWVLERFRWSLNISFVLVCLLLVVKRCARNKVALNVPIIWWEWSTSDMTVYS